VSNTGDEALVVELNRRAGWLGAWPQQGLCAVLDPENARIRAFLIEQAEQLVDGALVLDAGAGRKPYRSLFARHTYRSTDMPGGFYQEPHDFECFLHDIPQPDNQYDAVVLTQVLEHVPDPWATLKEIHRVLKPDGRLLLSVPLTAPLHGEPWHFFHFTHYGLQRMANMLGFVPQQFEKMGGAFWVLGKRLPDAFIKLFKQYDPFRARKRGQSSLSCLLLNVVLSPLFLLGYLPAAYVLRPLFYWLDALDREKSFTLGYTLVLVKQGEASSKEIEP
jgi:SAM-dependent methyltransferase